MDNIKKELDNEYKSYILMSDKNVLMSDELSYQDMLSYHTALSTVLLMIGIDYSYLHVSIDLARENAKKNKMEVDNHE